MHMLRSFRPFRWHVCLEYLPMAEMGVRYSQTHECRELTNRVSKSNRDLDDRM